MEWSGQQYPSAAAAEANIYHLIFTVMLQERPVTSLFTDGKAEA